MHSPRRGPAPRITLATFRGRDLPSVSEAVRLSMGDQAMILRVRTVRDGRSTLVEIVAAAGPEAERFRARLEPAALPEPKSATGGKQPLVIALVGPSGAGKTTTIAKLATHNHAFGSWKAGFLTLDTFRIGALAELEAYAEITGHPMEVAYDEDDVDAALDRLSDCDVILVDTPGRGSISRERRAPWFPLLQRIRPDETHFVVPASARPDATITMREALNSVGITHLLITKLDEVLEDSGVADIALELRLPSRWVADGNELPGSLHAGPARIIASLAEMSDPSTGLRISA
jgi:flagellar biosynthesis protein FlhF